MTRTTPHLYAPLGVAPVPYQRALYVYAAGSGATHTRAATCAPLGMVRRSNHMWPSRPWQARTSAGSTWHRTLRQAVRYVVAQAQPVCPRPVPHERCACTACAPTLCWPPAPLPTHWPLYAAGGRTRALCRSSALAHMAAAGVRP